MRMLSYVLNNRLKRPNVALRRVMAWTHRRWKNGLEQHRKHLASGNASQAIGLADGVVRTLERERAAMDDVLRALKQKKKLKQRYEGREDRDRWEAMLKTSSPPPTIGFGAMQRCCLSR